MSTKKKVVKKSKPIIKTAVKKAATKEKVVKRAKAAPKALVKKSTVKKTIARSAPKTLVKKSAPTKAPVRVASTKSTKPMKIQTAEGLKRVMRAQKMLGAKR